MKCGTCGAHLQEQDAFCGTCGAELPSDAHVDLDALPPPDSDPVEEVPADDAAPSRGAARDTSTSSQPAGPTPAHAEDLDGATRPAASLRRARAEARARVGQDAGTPPPTGAPAADAGARTGSQAPDMGRGDGGGSAGGGFAALGGGGSSGPSLASNRTLLAALAAGAVLLLLVVAGMLLLRDGSSGVVIGGGDAVAYGGNGIGRALPVAPGAEPAELWSDDFPSVLDAAIRGDNLLLLTGEYDGEWDLELLALALDSGDERWSVDVDDPQTRVVVGTDDDAVILASYDYSENPDPELIVLDDAGEEVWAEGYDDFWVELLPQGRLAVGVDGETEVLDLASGEELFGADGSLVSVTAGHLVLVEDEDVVVLDDDGEELWSDSFEEGVNAAAGDGLVYVLEPDSDELLARDVGTGEERWEADLDESGHYVEAAPGLGVRAAGSGDNELFNTAGELVWDDRDNFGTLVDRDGTRLYIRVWDDEIEVVDATTGDRVARERLGDDLFPASGDRLTRDAVLVADETELMALGLTQLEERWAVDVDGDAIGHVVVGNGHLAIVSYDDDGGDETIVTVLR